MYSYDHKTLMTLGLERWQREPAPKTWQIERDEIARRRTARHPDVPAPKPRLRLRLWQPQKPASLV
ncbi:hypothetical protein TRL7639_00236 [Falsiruegeria litorea R37]|uniref:Uncharacterized protein n=1 Tax=Falsiruegeria litorea R37 TaxID=1200284 RepID=A0A1Y5RHL8_9RHOB|nr:hypothetical protein TRL7639_00236 [Falsiruegeria litorea R37]